MSGERTYPLPPADEEDARFTIGLVLDVAQVLKSHGYPNPAGNTDDLVELRQALYRYLHERAETGR